MLTADHSTEMVVVCEAASLLQSGARTRTQVSQTEGTMLPVKIWSWQGVADVGGAPEREESRGDGWSMIEF